MPTLLLVEDNDLNREMLSRRLLRRDFQLLTAATGSDVLRLVRTRAPDLILMDMSLPDIDGWDLTRQLKQAPGTRNIPIIALTAQALEGDRKKALEVGCDDYETKPIDLPKLLAKIEHYLGRNAFHEAGDRMTARTIARPPESTSMASSATSAAILVVADQEDERATLARRLGRAGYRVVPARTSHETLGILRDQTFDLVFLDLVTTEKASLEMLRHIRAAHSMASLPVIVATAAERKEQAVNALKNGANDFVTHPLDFQAILARIESHLAVQKVLRKAEKAPLAAAPVSVAADAGQRFNRPAPRDQAVYQTASLGLSKPAQQLSATRCDDTLHALKRLGDTPPRQRPALIAGYEILEELGRGGMGVVYKARHQRMRRLAAIKVIDQKHLGNPEAVQRFYKEVEAVSQLSHRNIVMAYDAGEWGDFHYFAMEYVEGADLAQVVQRDGPLPSATACTYIVQTARGLQHANEKGLVHRDIKPSNLLVTHESGRPLVKILDMGLALLHQPEAHATAAAGLTRDGRVVGTADYMAPEQWMNAHKVDIRADLYSLGCTFYYLLARQVPFPGDEPMEKMLKHHMNEPIPLEQLRPDVPAPVVAVVRRLMAKNPDLRYQLPGELLEALH